MLTAGQALLTDPEGVMEEYVACCKQKDRAGTFKSKFAPEAGSEGSATASLATAASVGLRVAICSAAVPAMAAAIL